MTHIIIKSKRILIIVQKERSLGYLLIINIEIAVLTRIEIRDLLLHRQSLLLIRPLRPKRL